MFASENPLTVYVVINLKTGIQVIINTVLPCFNIRDNPCSQGDCHTLVAFVS